MSSLNRFNYTDNRSFFSYKRNPKDIVSADETVKNNIEQSKPDELRERISQQLISDILNGRLDFPYKRSFSDDVYTVFNNLKVYRPRFSHEKYYLKSYYPRYKLFLPPFFRTDSLSIVSSKEDHDAIDILSDLFLEQFRILCHRKNNPSPYEGFRNPLYVHKIIQDLMTKPITMKNLRESIYNIIPETKPFRCTWIKGLLMALDIPYFRDTSQSSSSDSAGPTIRMLDISAGWGDRLLTAMSCNLDYLGYDPNKQLEPAHNAMINLFGHPSHHQVLYEPFEDAVLPNEIFDVVLSSPPFFDLEIYTDKINDMSQSINRYPNFNTWLVQFLFVSLKKAWNSLKNNGYFLIHMGDTADIKICEPMNLFIEEYLLHSSYEGIISVVGETNIHRPVWIWRKINGYIPSSSSSKYSNMGKRWNPHIERSLLSRYPELTEEMIAYCHKVKLSM